MSPNIALDDRGLPQREPPAGDDPALDTALDGRLVRLQATQDDPGRLDLDTARAHRRLDAPPDHENAVALRALRSGHAALDGA